MAARFASMLSCGALEKMQKEIDVTNPVLQILDLKPVKDSRLRAYLWDGVEEFNYGMISSQAIPPIEDKLKPLCLIKVKNFNLTITKEKPILILMDCEVVATAAETGERIRIGEGQKRGATENKTTPELRTPSKMPKLSQSSGTPSRSNIMPISALNPFQSRCTIRGRVSSKGAIRTWSKATGEGKLFAFDMLDESGEVRITAFNAECDKYFEMIQPKKVYTVSGFQTKAANKQFRTNNNEYEITLGKFSSIEPCEEECDDLPEQTYNFVRIADIESLPAEQIIDVCGVLKSSGEVQTFNRKSDGKALIKRELQLVDDSRKMIMLTVWGDSVDKFDRNDHPVLVITKARTSTFNNALSLSTGAVSTFDFEPDLDKARAMKKWWTTEGQNTEFESIRGAEGAMDYAQEWMDFEMMSRKSEQIDGVSDKPIYVWNRVTITMFNKDNAMYRACGNESCMKKVQEQGSGTYYCEKCATPPGPSFRWRMILKMVVTDATRQFWCTAFNERAEQILGVTAATLGDYSESNPDEMDRIFSSAMFKEFHMKFRGKMDVYQDERRFQLSVVDAKEAKIVDDCKHLVSDIQKLSALLQ